MKNYLNTLTHKTTHENTENTTLEQDAMSMAADNVHRIAMRNPALFQTKSVPRVSNLSISNTGPGGLA